MKEGAKYQPLYKYLLECAQSEVTLSFEQIETQVGIALPISARTNSRWWSNRKKGAPQALAWYEADYSVVKVDFEGSQVTFARIIHLSSLNNIQSVNDVVWNSTSIKALRLQMGITQKQLAQKLGVRQQTISEWENAVYAPSRAMSKFLSLLVKTPSCD